MSTYTPVHHDQFEPLDRWSPFDCNMAACADLARWYSLGLIDHTHTWFREHSGDMAGGTNIDAAHHALEAAGVHVAAVYDGADGKSWQDVRTSLLSGSGVIAHGDYGRIPSNLDGEHSPNFQGTHSVYFHLVRADGEVHVGDGLHEKWVYWPASVASGYMRDFPGGGYTYLVVKPRRLQARVKVANVRPEPNRDHKPIAQITPRSRLHAGGTVRGERVGGNATWWRVWAAGRIGYVHSSVGEIA